jgi:hypothetical protein
MKNTDMKFNVWTIKKDGKFFNIQKSEMRWVDDIAMASFFNHNNATLTAQSKGFKDYTIVKIS